MFFKKEIKKRIAYFKNAKKRIGQIQLSLVLEVLFGGAKFFLGGEASSDPHRKLQSVIGSQKNYILNALLGRIGSR